MKKWTSILLVVCLLVLSLIPSILFETNKANAQSTAISLGFSPADAVMDPELPVVYLTKLGSKNLTAVNYETGKVKTITLPHPSERVEVYGDYVYATQQKTSRSRYSIGHGGIAIMKRSDFSLVRVENIPFDPMDIAIDKDGYMYITPGSGQWVDLKVYNLADFTEVKQTVNSATSLYAGAKIFYSKENSKMYTVDAGGTPMDIDAFEVDHGQIIDHYDSPYHGDYSLEVEANITPDGLHFYSHSGAVFDLAPLKTGDMTYSHSMGEDYYDFAFSLADNLTFAANAYGGIDVFTYNTNEFLYSLKENVVPEKLLYNNGLFVVYADENNKYYCEFITDLKHAPFSVVNSAVIDLGNLKDQNPPKLTDGMVNVPTNTIIAIQFSQNLTIRNLNGIKLSGSNGEVPIFVDAEHGILLIQADNLNLSSDYKLSIKKESMTGYLNEALPSDLTYSFKTKIPPIKNLSVTTDSSLAPKEYSFRATSTGGQNVEYKFSVIENGTWKVLQEYSSSSSITWIPTSKGTFQFKVEARSASSTKTYENLTEFSQTVTDNESPKVTIKKSTKLTNKPVSIQLSATDNVGVKSITLPNNKVVLSSNTTYQVSKNGTYKFIVTDLLGNTTKKEVVVNNIDTSAPKIGVTPSTKEITLSTVFLVANASDASGIAKIILPNGSEVNGTNAIFPVSKNGTYKFIVEDKAGNRTTKSFVVSNIRPPAPTVSAVWNSHTSITGNATPNATVTAKVGSKVIGQGKASQTGKFSIKITKQSAGAKVVVTASLNGGTSNAKNVTVLDKIPPSKPVVNKVTTKTTSVTGKAEKNATVYVYVGSKKIGQGKVDSKGTFKIKIAKQRKGTKLSVYAIDAAKNKSDSTVVTVN